MPEPLALVFDYRQAGKQAMNVLAGSLELVPELAAVPLTFVPRGDSLVEAIQAALAEAERVLVAWSFYSPGFGQAVEALHAVRETVDDPRVLHIAGGVHATAEPEQTLRAGFDLVAVGEGERLIQELVGALRAGEAPTVRGVATLEGDRVVLRGRGEPVADLDAFPPFAMSHARLGPIEITRGCIYACGFCQTPFLNKARFRHRSLENVFHWVEQLVSVGFRDFRFISPTSLSYGAGGTDPDLERLEALLAGVRARIGPERRLFYGTFPSELRPEHVTRPALELLQRYVDNDSLIIGAQSGSEAVLAATHRGHGVPVIEAAVRLALETGFRPHVDFIFGLPGELAPDVEASLALAERLADLGARVHGHTFMPLPGTPLKDAPPGRLTAATKRRLLHLVSRGKLYGQWERQGETALRLARQRLPLARDER